MIRPARKRDPRPSAHEPYAQFQQISGSHPLKNQLPESVLEYPVQELPQGRVSYFNFRLAKEMGLLPKNHPHRLTKELEKVLLKTFCIRIYNEYDQHQKTPPVGSFKPETFMATRYLQLQHRDKQGRTSGDGRSIWNGVFKSQGRTWDISSRGTGVTKLSPGAAQADKLLATGSTEFGYGCGLAELDELFSSTLMSEVMHAMNFRTERMLCVIDLGRGLGIGVRAAENLLRPAHLFLHLKQGNHAALKKAFEYFVERQIKNGHWGPEARRPEVFLRNIGREFGQFAARLEFHYIFLWMDWDGDNLLAHAGIIDYGSVRQFGLRHHRYRYDDVERFSTCLSEQRLKARATVQVFAQMADFLRRGQKKPLKSFQKSKSLKEFDKAFESTLVQEFESLWGAKASAPSRSRSARRALAALTKIEKICSRYQPKKLPDGVNRPALYSRRKLLKTWAEAQQKGAQLPLKSWHQASLADAAWGKDRRLTRARARAFQDLDSALRGWLGYLQRSGTAPQEALGEVLKYAQKPLATGNALVEVVSMLLGKERSSSELQVLCDRLIDHFAGQNLRKFGPEQSFPNEVAEDFQKCLLRAQELSEDI